MNSFHLGEFDAPWVPVFGIREEEEVKCLWWSGCNIEGTEKGKTESWTNGKRNQFVPVRLRWRTLSCVFRVVFFQGLSYSRSMTRSIYKERCLIIGNYVPRQIHWITNFDMFDVSLVQIIYLIIIYFDINTV